MSWIIKNSKDGMYLYSADVKVKEKAFARRFSTRRQAVDYLRTSVRYRDDYEAEELTDTEISEAEKEIHDLRKC